MSGQSGAVDDGGAGTLLGERQRTELASRLPAATLDRPRLHARLDLVAQRRLTVVSAAAGSGKTVLLATWARHAAIDVGWVRMDEPALAGRSWWAAVAGALEQATGTEVAPSHDGVAELLATRGAPVALVVDDAHLIAGDRLLAGLLDLPGSLRLVLGARHDPPLALHRLRLTDQLLELRQADLAFRPDEARALMWLDGLELDDRQVALVTRRTEGWAAGLRMAALALDSVSGSALDQRLDEFAGDDRAIADYLASEVLESVDAPTRDLLLRGSVLESMSGPLLDALTGRTDGAATLAELERRNAFLVPLDRRREWYRQHQLLRDLLALHRRWELPGEDAELHRRAGAWLAAEGRPLEALRQYVAAAAWGPALAILTRDGPALAARGHIGELAGLVGAIPVAALEQAPVPAAIAAVLAPDPSRAARLRTAAATDPVIGAVVELAGAAGGPGLGPALAAAERVLPGDGPPVPRAWALAALGAGRLWAGRLVEADAALTDAVALARAHDLPDVCSVAAGLQGIVALSQGRLRCGHDLAVGALDASTSANGTLGVPAELALCLIALERDDVAVARRHADHAEQALADGHRGAIQALARMAGAALLLAEGRPVTALQELAGAPAPPEVLRWPTALVLVRALMALGRHAEAGRMLESAPEAPSTRVVRAAWLRAGGRGAEAALLAESIGADAPLHARVEALVVGALVAADAGDGARGGELIERALDEAEREGMRRPFVVHGRAVVDLLEAQLVRGTAHRAFVEGIVDAARRDRPADAGELSPRELAVLRFLPTAMTGGEIARELVVSTNTVRTHIRHIYEKLGAHSRGEAVRAARERGLLAPARASSLR